VFSGHPPNNPLRTQQQQQKLLIRFLHILLTITKGSELKFPEALCNFLSFLFKKRSFSAGLKFLGWEE
jgi:hypothetical protein